MSFIIIQSVVLSPNREQANSPLQSNPSQPLSDHSLVELFRTRPFYPKTLLTAGFADPFSVSVSSPPAEAPQTSLAASPPPAPRCRHPSLLPPRISGGAASLVTVSGAGAFTSETSQHCTVRAAQDPRPCPQIFTRVRPAAHLAGRRRCCPRGWAR